MRYFKICTLLAITSVSSIGLCWVNDVFFVKGKIRSFDQNVVRVETSPRHLAEIPRNAIPQAYKLSTIVPKMSVPILSKQIDEIKWKRIPSATKLGNPDFTSDQVIKYLALEYTKAKKAN
jgi:hypothetical protein